MLHSTKQTTYRRKPPAVEGPLSRLLIQGLRSIVIGPVDLSLDAGEIVCISGPSASGKTLFLRAVADLDPHAGSVSLDGKACEHMPGPAWRRHVGLLPAESHWWREQVGAHFDIHNADAVNALGLEPGVFDKPISQCSTGERQRLALLRLLQNQPSVLLLDEPTAALDPTSTAQAEKYITDYCKSKRASCLWISHDPEQVKRVARRHYRVQDGKLMETPLV